MFVVLGLNAYTNTAVVSNSENSSYVVINLNNKLAIYIFLPLYLLFDARLSAKRKSKLSAEKK